ncbi:MAG: DUF547 domain-containing protein [Planctomycetes bacterium]|nr:DUF547 domain-containing protein [Planctomycetota bacterium]
MKKEYSGRLLWLALASFLMPVAVAVWAFRSLPQPYTYPEIKPDASGVDQQLWNYLLQTYVADGLIDYDGLKRNHLFKTYLTQVASAQPEKLPDDQHRLAFLCNAYNAFVINGVLVHKIDSSVLDYKNPQDKGFFDVPEHILAGKTVDLNTLEHKMIRAVYQEPRVHMALVCAAKSCPTIRPEAFVGERLDAQLEDQTRAFANNQAYVRYETNGDDATGNDTKEEKLYLSPILKWYAEDFGGPRGVLDFLLSRVKSPKTSAGLLAAREGKIKVVYNEYDWSLNTQGKAAASKTNTSFGSGSIPNE